MLIRILGRQLLSHCWCNLLKLCERDQTWSHPVCYQPLLHFVLWSTTDRSCVVFAIEDFASRSDLDDWVSLVQHGTLPNQENGLKPFQVLKRVVFQLTVILLPDTGPRTQHILDSTHKEDIQLGIQMKFVFVVNLKQNRPVVVKKQKNNLYHLVSFKWNSKTCIAFGLCAHVCLQKDVCLVCMHPIYVWQRVCMCTHTHWCRMRRHYNAALPFSPILHLSRGTFIC